MKKPILYLLVLTMLLALPMAAQAYIDIDPDIRTDDGLATLYWTASDGSAPFMLGYRYVPEDGSDQLAFWAGDDEETSTTKNNYFTFKTLLSGHQYYVQVFNDAGDIDGATITIPDYGEFEDGKLKAKSVRTSVDYRRIKKGSDSVGSVDQLTASDMMKNMENYYYGLRYEITLPELAYARDYFVQIAMTAPNGYMQTVHTSQYTFSTGTGFTHYLRFMGEAFFLNLYNNFGEIPVGTYTIELYFNGMLANTRTFRIR